MLAVFYITVLRKIQMHYIPLKQRPKTNLLLYCLLLLYYKIPNKSIICLKKHIKIGKSQSTALERVNEDLRSKIDSPINYSISQSAGKSNKNGGASRQVGYIYHQLQYIQYWSKCQQKYFDKFQRRFVGDVCRREGENRKEEAQSPRGSKASQNKSAVGASASNNSIPQNIENGNKKISTDDDYLGSIADEEGNVSDVTKSLKSDGKSGKINSKGSKQSGVMWTMAEGVLDNREVAAFYSKISEMKKQGYKNFNRTTDGEYIFEINNKLVVTDGKYMKPTITEVITFNSENDTLNAGARRIIYEAGRNGYSVRESLSLVEDVYGEGFALRTNIGNRETNQKLHDGRRKGSDGTEVDSRSGENVDDTDILGSIDDNATGKSSNVTAADIESGNISEALRARLDSYKKVMEQMGFKVIYESHRATPKNTIGYVDFTNREVYLSPGHIDEALLTHELTHVIDRGYDGKYVKSLISFFKKQLADDWNKKYNDVKKKYEGIKNSNLDFAYTESTLEAETLAEMCTEFTTDEYIKKAAEMDIGTIKQIWLVVRYMRHKIKMLFGDESSAHKMKIASLKWQMIRWRCSTINVRVFLFTKFSTPYKI